jgi:hypothetical protein
MAFIPAKEPPVMQARTLQFTMAVGLLFVLPHCGLFDIPEDEPTKKVTLKGTVAVPDAPSDVIILSDAQHTAYQWNACYAGTQDSNLQGGQFLLESTNNCAGAQYVYFYDTSPRDMKAYAKGTIKFKVQANNANQNLSVLIQDANTTVSNTVNLSLYGFDGSKVAVDQAIAIPVTALTVPSFDFSKVDRLFQLVANCSASDCFTTLKDIRWSPPATLSTAPALSFEKASFSPMAARIPHCDPFPCRGARHARVNIIKSTPLGWKAEPAVNSVVTDSEGHYTIQVDVSILKNAVGPVFIGASDADGTFTFLSTIPNDQMKESATINLAVDRTTTAVGMMVCANGMTIPSDGSGGWCIGDPISTSELETFNTTVDLSFNTTGSGDPEVFLADVFDDPLVLAALNNLLSAHGEAAVTLDQLQASDDNLSLPAIPPPPSSNSTGTGGTTGTNANKSCQAAVACEICSVTACAATNTSTCAAWYETSDGGKYSCTGDCNNLDCVAAAKAATEHCCPPPK